MDAITIDKLSKHFGAKQALKSVSFAVPSGSIYGFLGPNGAGKTTTIRCLMDFIRPSSGQLSVFGLDSRKSSVAIHQQLGYLSSDNALYDHWTGRDHIRLSEHVRGRAPYARELARDLQLNLKTRYNHLSSGNKQKLAIVLALMHKPKLLVLDEPTRGLDPLLQNRFYQLLRDFRNGGGTVFMSSHNLPEVEQVCDQVGVIRDGRMVKSESMDRLRQLRTHLITAVLMRPVDIRRLRLPRVAVIHHSDSTVALKVKGDINPVMQILTHHGLRDLEVTHASLEDIFLEYYKI